MNLKNYLILYLKGIAMGSADSVPGVSGGTIAFISGIYEELIYSIRSFNFDALKLLLKFKIKELWSHINGTFLAVLISGIITAILLMLRIILYCLEFYPEVLWAFFFGLILSSALVILKKITQINIYVIINGITGLILGYLISIAIPVETTNDLWFIFLSGSIAICAMILPGISGSFILVLLGKYEFILHSLKGLQIDIILVFACGAAIGLLLFSHLLNWMLKKYYNNCISILTGIMLGSLNKVWPWKNTIETYTGSHGNIKPLIQENVFPWNYLELTNKEPYIAISIIFVILGFMLIYCLSYITQKNKKII